MTTQMTTQIKKAVFTMEPFTCPSCVKKIENTVGRIDGVQEVKVMFNSGRVRVEFDEHKTTADAVQEIIVKLGYPVLSYKVALPAISVALNDPLILAVASGQYRATL